MQLKRVRQNELQICEENLLFQFCLVIHQTILPRWRFQLFLTLSNKASLSFLRLPAKQFTQLQMIHTCLNAFDLWPNFPRENEQTSFTTVA